MTWYWKYNKLRIFVLWTASIKNNKTQCPVFMFEKLCPVSIHFCLFEKSSPSKQNQLLLLRPITWLLSFFYASKTALPKIVLVIFFIHRLEKRQAWGISADQSFMTNGISSCSFVFSLFRSQYFKTKSNRSKEFFEMRWCCNSFHFNKLNNWNNTSHNFEQNTLLVIQQGFVTDFCRSKVVLVLRD